MFVLYINLDHDRDRRAHIECRLAQDGLDPVRIDALEPPFILPDALFATALSVGEIGCYASHMKAWDTLIASGRPYALVLEDDAQVPPNIAELVQKTLTALPEHWDLVHLYDREHHPARPLRTLSEEHALVRYSRVPGGSVAYLISRTGARKLRRQSVRCWPLDTDFRRPWHFNLDSYGVRPPLIEHNSDFDSALLRRGPRSRRRRGLAFSSPLHSLEGAIWNIRKLGPRWWLHCLALNSWRRFVKAVSRPSWEWPFPSRSASRRQLSSPELRARMSRRTPKAKEAVRAKLRQRRRAAN